MNVVRTITGGGAKWPLVTAVFLALTLAIACGGNAKPAASPSAGPRGAGTAAIAATASGTPFAATVTGSPVPSSSTLRTPVATPTETPDDSPMAKVIVPKANINAKFVTVGIIAATNTMDSPKNKDDVAYYDFTPRPGYNGNTVISGHVDWYTGQTGVFWDMKKLVKGDDIQIVLQDGKTYRYKVTNAQLYDADTAPIEQIIGDTPVESVTLITCEGTFDRAAAEYNKRRVVRAERVYS